MPTKISSTFTGIWKHFGWEPKFTGCKSVALTIEPQLLPHLDVQINFKVTLPVTRKLGFERYRYWVLGIGRYLRVSVLGDTVFSTRT